MIDLAPLIEEVRKTTHIAKRAQDGWLAAEEALSQAARHQRDAEKDAIEARQALVNAIVAGG